VVRDRAQLLGELARPGADVLAPDAVAVLHGLPVGDLEVDVALAQDQPLRLDREVAPLLLEELALLGRGRGTAPGIGHVVAHVVEPHPGRGQAGDRHQLVEVVLAVDAVAAAGPTADRGDDPDLS
jgi:hypothetical protein